MVSCSITFLCIFFFNDPATTEIYTYLHTLSLHDALPISHRVGVDRPAGEGAVQVDHVHPGAAGVAERARLCRRVVVVDRGGIHGAAQQAHELAVIEVDRRVTDHVAASGEEAGPGSSEHGRGSGRGRVGQYR